MPAAPNTGSGGGAGGTTNGGSGICIITYYVKGA
jgi:hypothetical protein